MDRRALSLSQPSQPSPGDRRPSLHRQPALAILSLSLQSPHQHHHHPPTPTSPPPPASSVSDGPPRSSTPTTPPPLPATHLTQHTLHTLHPACGTAAMSGPTPTTRNVAPPTDPGPGNLVDDAEAARRAANVVVGKSSRARPNKGQVGWGNLAPDILQYVAQFRFNLRLPPARRRKLTVQAHPRVCNGQPQPAKRDTSGGRACPAGQGGRAAQHACFDASRVVRVVQSW